MQPCTDTVSLLHALILGADGACINLSFWSILLVLIPVGLAITALQWLVKRLLFGARKTAPDTPVTHGSVPRRDNNPFRDGPIR